MTVAMGISLPEGSIHRPYTQEEFKAELLGGRRNFGRINFHQLYLEDPEISKYLASLSEEDRLDFTGASLTGLKGEGVDLRRFKLERTRLDYSNLNGANLSGVLLYETELPGTQLEGADLSQSKIWGSSNLGNANLSKANLSGAHIAGGSVIDGANLEGANCQHIRFGEISLLNVHFKGADLSHAEFNGVRNIDMALELDATILWKAKGKTLKDKLALAGIHLGLAYNILRRN